MISWQQKLDKILLFLIFLCLAAAPLYVIRFHFVLSPLAEFSYPTTLLELFLFLLFLVWVIRKIFSLVWLGEPLVEEWSALSVLILILLGLASVSAVISPVLRSSLGIFKAYFLEPVLFYFLLRDLRKIETLPKWIVSGLFLSGFWLAILGIGQGLFGVLAVTPHELPRAHGVYNSANALALYLGPLIILIAAFLSNHDRAGENFFLYRKSVLRILLLVLLAAFGLSCSLGGIVGLLAASLFLLLSTRNFQKAKRFLLFSVPLLFVFTIFFVFFIVPQITPEKNIPVARVSDSTVVIRLCLWEGTRDMLLQRTSLGAGLSGFKHVYRDFRTCDNELLEYPHNIFLNFWSEIGLLGVLVFLFFCGLWVFRIDGEDVSGRGKRIIASAFLAQFVYFLVHGLVDVPYFKNDLALQFWTLVAFSVNWF
ncbi:MAG: O-antigen ligase family protein [Patescibacteria group bacterium]